MTHEATVRTDAPRGDEPRQGFSRRSLLQWSAAVGGTTALVSTLPGSSARAAGPGAPEEESTFVWSACTVNCGSRCRCAWR